MINLGKILYYYKGLHEPSRPFGGSSQATLTSASCLIALKQNLICGGDRVKNAFTLSHHEENVHVITTKAESDFTSYDTVIFANHLFTPIQKKGPSQKWILDQHSWAIDPSELKRIDEFELILARSEIHKCSLIESGVPENKIKVVSNCIDVNFFKQTSEFRNQYSFLFVGAVVAHKKIHLLLEAFIKVLESYPQATLSIAGSSSLWNDSSEYEDKLKNYKIPGVTFLGNIAHEQLPSLYSTHSVVVLPSTLESFGLVTIEAQSCGCIPVVHKCGGTPATVEHCHTGFLYAPNTADNIAATMKTALEYSIKNPEIRLNARKFAENNFSLERLRSDWENIIS